MVDESDAGAPPHGAEIVVERGEADPTRFDPVEPIGWLLLHDPRWDAAFEPDEAPAELIAGGWPVLESGELGEFHANDLHRAGPFAEPGDPADPDPVGAALELVADGRAPVQLAQLVLRDSTVSVAMNADDRPLVTRSGDDRLCAVVATCDERRAESEPPEWAQVDAEGLADLLVGGLDVLFNPAGPAPVRVSGTLIDGALRMTDLDVQLALDYLVETRAEGLRGSRALTPSE